MSLSVMETNATDPVHSYSLSELEEECSSFLEIEDAQQRSAFPHTWFSGFPTCCT